MAARICALVALLALPSVQAANPFTRVNSTGAIGTFMISDCAECTKDRNSIFCTTAKSDSNFVMNGSSLPAGSSERVKVTIKMKKDMPKYGAADGGKFCWAGTCPRGAGRV
jgi:hypothetical protein